MFRKGLLARLLLALGIALGALAVGTGPGNAEEGCLHVDDDDLGYYKVCHPVP